MVREPMADGLAALELAGTITVLILMVLAEAFGQPSIFDIALAFVVLSYPSGLVFAHFLEALAVNMGIGRPWRCWGSGWFRRCSAPLVCWSCARIRQVSRGRPGGDRRADRPRRRGGSAGGPLASGDQGHPGRPRAVLVGPIVTHATARAEWVRAGDLSIPEAEAEAEEDSP